MQKFTSNYSLVASENNWRTIGANKPVCKTGLRETKLFRPIRCFHWCSPGCITFVAPSKLTAKLRKSDLRLELLDRCGKLHDFWTNYDFKLTKSTFWPRIIRGFGIQGIQCAWRV